MTCPKDHPSLLICSKDEYIDSKYPLEDSFRFALYETSLRLWVENGGNDDDFEYLSLEGKFAVCFVDGAPHVCLMADPSDGLPYESQSG